MTNLDQFESVFKSADRQLFSSVEIELETILLVADGDTDQSEQMLYDLKQILAGIPLLESATFDSISGDQYDSIQQLMGMIEQRRPDLICTVRNLKSFQPELPHRLGSYVDVMTQVLACPVLLLPRPGPECRWTAVRDVMAITDHLAGDNQLVSHACYFTPAEGTLILAHVEDQRTFDRYVQTIAKIPTIETAMAESLLREQLLKEPTLFIENCRQQLVQQRGDSIQIEAVVTIGQQLEDYRKLIEQHQLDLLVMNTKDDDQLAMHGLAYPLTIELCEIPLLLL